MTSIIFRQGRVSASIMARLHNTSLIFTDQVIPLPPLVTQRVTLEMPEAEKEVLKTVVKKCTEILVKHHSKVVENKVGYARVLRELLRVRQATVSPLLVLDDQVPDASLVGQEDAEGAVSEEKLSSKEKLAADAAAIQENMSLKLVRAQEMVRAFVAEGRRVLVFCNFLAPLFALAADYGDGAAVLFGDVSEAEQNSMIQEFNDPTSAARVLYVSTDCGGTGLNLQAASAVVHLDRWWNPGKTEQATGRIHRLGQTRDCVAVHVEYAASFDDVCHDLYNVYKSQNSKKLRDRAYENAYITFDAAAATAFMEELAVRLKMADEAATLGRLVKKATAKASKHAGGAGAGAGASSGMMKLMKKMREQPRGKLARMRSARAQQQAEYDRLNAARLERARERAAAAEECDF